MPASARAQGFWLGLVLVIATLLKGSSEPWARAIVVLTVAAASYSLLRSRKGYLRGRPWLLAGGLGLGVIGTAWIPLPKGLLGWVAPGVLLARPGQGWDTVGLRPEESLEAGAIWLTICVFGACATAWASSSRARPLLVPWTGLVFGGLALVVLLHRGMGAETVLGCISVSEPQSRMFLPFVNQNHLAAAFVVFLPLWVGSLLEGGVASRTGIVSALATTAVSMVVLSSQSASGIGIFVLVVVLTCLHFRPGGKSVLWVLVVSSSILALLLPHTTPSVAGRLSCWKDTLAMIADFPLAGVGGGGFEFAMEAYRSDFAFVTWSHAHNEFLQYLSEFGLVGILGLALAGRLLWPKRDSRQDPVQTRLWIGLLGLGIQCLVEFPLRLTSIALTAAVAWAFLIGLGRTRSHQEARGSWRGIHGFTVLLLVFSAWLFRTHFVEERGAAVRNESPTSALPDSRVLEMTAPWRGERALHRAWALQRDGDLESALALVANYSQDHADDADLLRRVAILQGESGDFAAAQRTVARVQERAPWDYRPHILAARFYMRMGEPLEAAKSWILAFERDAPTGHLQEALKTQPIGVWWVDALGELSPTYSFEIAKLLVEEDVSVARLAMDQAVLLDSEFYGLRAFHADLMWQSGDEPAAEELIRKGLEQNATDTALLQTLSKLRAHQGRWAEARDTMLRAAEQRPILRKAALIAIEKADGPGEVQAQYEAWRRQGPVSGEVSLQAAAARFRAGDSLGCVLILEEANLVVSHSHGTQAEELMAACSH